MIDQDIAAVLRTAIKTCGHSAAEIARQTGVPQPTITRFLQGADMRLSTASRLASFLKMSLRKNSR